jgi:DNA invertase Pin-like site-specific DNA recombinase
MIPRKYRASCKSTEEQIEQIKGLKNSGYSYKEIAILTKTTHHIVRYWIDEKYRKRCCKKQPKETKEQKALRMRKYRAKVSKLLLKID